MKLADPPEWVVELMSRSTPSFRSGSRAPSAKEPIPEGSRNDQLFRLACRWQRFGWSDERISDEAHRMNRRLCKPPLGDREVEKIVSSVLRYPKGS
jgi:hypothetical protein